MPDEIFNLDDELLFEAEQLHDAGVRNLPPNRDKSLRDFYRSKQLPPEEGSGPEDLGSDPTLPAAPERIAPLGDSSTSPTVPLVSQAPTLNEQPLAGPGIPLELARPTPPRYNPLPLKIPPPQELDESKALVSQMQGIPPTPPRILQRLLAPRDSGKVASNQQLLPYAASIIGAPDDSVVTITGSNAAPRPGVMMQLTLEVVHPMINDMARMLYTNEQGQRCILNDRLYLKPRYRGNGSRIGLVIFGRQVHNASLMDYQKIHTMAAGNFEIALSRQGEIGYYVWLRYGYDCQLLQYFRDHPWQADTIEELFPEAESLLDIMETEEVELDRKAYRETANKLDEFNTFRGKPSRPRLAPVSGREWWLVHGHAIYHAIFDLRQGSRSRLRFAEHLQAAITQQQQQETSHE